ncbi:MAG: hypothetical protein S4CHLAM2_09030 [Chlamydiales bacterium]|nr:hypothetical protein [Chlamydiales bacterium]
MPLFTTAYNICSEQYCGREQPSEVGKSRTQITYISNTQRTLKAYGLDVFVGLSLLVVGVVSLHFPATNPAVTYSLLTAGGLYSVATGLMSIRSFKSVFSG